MTVQARVTPTIAPVLEDMYARNVLWLFACLEHENAWVGSESRAVCWS